MKPQDIILCQRPRKLTVSEVERLVKQHDQDSREALAGFILHRLRDRYITPIEHIPSAYKSGFLTMAACCLLIEAYQCFKDGLEDTHGRGEGAKAFSRFFSAHATDILELTAQEFYEHVRCGILHQAQTQDCIRILRTGPLFDETERTINATRFLRRLKSVVEDYVEQLQRLPMDQGDWPNALKKVGFICAASKQASARSPRARRP